MSKYKMFFLHDPIGNYESQITNFDKGEIQMALDQGLSIIGITQDDNREIVKSVDDVVEPKVAMVEGITMVLPSYVDSKVDNLAKIVEQIANSLSSSHVISSSILGNIKNSIQKIHEEAEKVIEEDKKMLDSSPSIIKREK